MFQGFFGSIITIIYYIIYSPFDEIIQFYKKRTTSEFIILIFAFLLFVILSGGKNLYRLETLRIYSPMTSTFMEYILNPLYNIYYFASGNDFLFKAKKLDIKQHNRFFEREKEKKFESLRRNHVKKK